ncbi:hypothetical protein ACN4EG_14150 [Alkalinema pantanalense CENA528]|uniref:hypothetical protein n=1 Tax=Alkalinema pantanalense TaxID=1620705 RepID=UPI003D6E8C9A
MTENSMLENSMPENFVDRMVRSQAWLNAICYQRLRRQQLRHNNLLPLNQHDPFLRGQTETQEHSQELAQERPQSWPPRLWAVHQGLEEIKQEIKQINMLLEFHTQDVHSTGLREFQFLFDRILAHLCGCLQELAIELLRLVSYLETNPSMNVISQAW